jgi:hypothetical protein
MENKISPVEAALVTNDLSKLTTDQRMSYYKNVCDSLGLNYLTQPFAYISLNGKLTLYAKRDATDQLRQIHNISINITSRELIGDVYIVTAKARNASGREDESMGTVSIANLKGDALANAYLKCETKAKRRVTLSICGLGLMDDTEVETIKEAVLVNEPIKIEEKKHDETIGKQDIQISKENAAPNIHGGPKQVSSGHERLSNGEPGGRSDSGNEEKINHAKEEIKIYPDKTKIKINKEQAEFLYSTGYKYGFSKDDITSDIYKLTKHLKLSDMNNAEFETVLNHFKDNSKRFS